LLIFIRRYETPGISVHYYNDNDEQYGPDLKEVLSDINIPQSTGDLFEG